MRKLTTLFLLGLLLLPAIAFSQDAPKFIYCEIVATGKNFSSEVTIEVDFGQRIKVFEDNRMKDETGKARVFKSTVDALNFMSKDSWEFVQAYVVPETSSYSGTHYL